MQPMNNPNIGVELGPPGQTTIPIQPMPTQAQPQMAPQPIIMQQPTVPQMMPGQPMMAPQPMYQGQPMMAPQPMYQGQPMMAPQPQMIPGQPMMAPQPVYQGPSSQQPLLQKPIPAYGPGQPQYAFIENPLLELANSKKCQIEQQIELLEILTGCETKNRYHVFIYDQIGYKKFLFKCKEESGWCMRNCCPANVRGFEMKMKHITSMNQMGEGYENYFVDLFRPFKCTCCCLARPELIAKYSKNQEAIGKVLEPFMCLVCDPVFSIYDKHSTLKYTVNADCCQCGFCSRANKIVQACTEVRFTIHKGADRSPSTICGEIIKKAGGAKQLVSDADTYDITFPDDALPEEKLMIIGATLMIDYRYFEDNGTQDQNNNNGGGPHHH